MDLSHVVCLGGRSRLLVETARNIVIYDPLDVAIEEMSKKVTQLRNTVQATRTDVKLLQMQLQGALSLQV